MEYAHLVAFATMYAAAWSDRNPDHLAGFYADDGVLRVNAAAPAVGRAEIRATALGFMTAFPDMTVTLLSVELSDPHVIFHWRWTGTNTGPGGTGKAVDLLGFEEWILGPDGRIVQSLGHFDEAEYQRQLQ